jgi:hypothetical protein
MASWVENVRVSETTYLCSLGHAFAENLDLKIAKVGVKRDRHDWGPCEGGWGEGDLSCQD